MNTFRNFRLAGVGAALLVSASVVATAQPPVSGRNGQGAMQRGGHRSDSGTVGQRGARGRGERGFGRRPEFAGGLLKGITLSAAQQEQFKALQQRHLAERGDSLRGRHRDGGQGDLRNGGRDRAGRQNGNITARQRPDSAARAAMLAQRQQQFDQRASEIRNILTAEQRATFDQNVRTMREKLAKGPEHAGKGRGQR
jgi:hypothetical protein